MEATSWSKLKDGTWGVRSPVALTEGQAVTVCRKDGSRSTATVGRKVWSGNGVWLYATAPTAPATGSGSAPRRNWHPCGYPGCHSGYCDECDGEGAVGRSDYY